MSFFRYGLALMIVPILSGCGGEGTAAARWEGGVDTLASGAVHVRNPATGAWAEDERMRLVEELRIGSLEGGGPESFGSVRAVTVDALGRIWVLEGQAAEIRVFDPDGGHVRTIGGQGEGPGELMFPTGLLWSPDGHLWVHDVQNRRHEIFDTAGTRIGSRPLEGSGLNFGGGVFGDDGLLHEMVPIPGEDGMRQVLVRSRVDGEERVPVDTLHPPVLPRTERARLTVEMGGQTARMMMPIPLQNNPSRRIHPGGYFVSNHGGESYRILQETFDGDTLRIIDREHEPVEVTDAEVEEVLDGLPEGARDGIDSDRIPRVRPPFETFVPANDGSLWVRRYRAPGQQAWDYFDPEGRYMGEVAMDMDPGRFTPQRISGNRVYGVFRDELDVPWVVRLRLGMSGGGEGEGEG